MNHIQYLISAEKHISSLIWDRVDANTIWVSTVGYRTAALDEVESKLLSMGLKYDLKLGISKFDPISGRTVTYLTETKGGTL